MQACSQSQFFRRAKNFFFWGGGKEQLFWTLLQRELPTFDESSHKFSGQAGRRLVRSLLTLHVFVVDVMDLRTGNRNEDDS